MLMLAIIFALTGAALGLRFKALVLAPASCFALASPVLTNFAYCYSLPVLALAAITTLMALQIGYLLGMRLGVDVVDNFRDHVAWVTAGTYLTLLAEIVLVLRVAPITPGIYLTLLAGIVLVLGYAVWPEWQQHIIIATQRAANRDFDLKSRVRDSLIFARNDAPTSRSKNGLACPTAKKV
jgi:hypothetical protein